MCRSVETRRRNQAAIRHTNTLVRFGSAFTSSGGLNYRVWLPIPLTDLLASQSDSGRRGETLKSPVPLWAGFNDSGMEASLKTDTTPKVMLS